MIDKPGYKHTPFGWIPEDWDVKVLSKVSLNGTQNGFYKGKDFYGKGYEMVHMTEVFAREVIENGDMPLVDLTQRELERFSLKEGDLLFARRSLALEGVGKCAIVGKISAPISFESSIIRVRLNKDLIDPLFAYYFISSSRGKTQMLKLARQVAVSGVTGEDLKFYKFPLPRLCEQRKISAILSRMDEIISNSQKIVSVLKQRNKGLMQELLTGKRRLAGFKSSWKHIHLSEAFVERSETCHTDLELLSIGSLGIYPQSQSDKRDTSNNDKSKYKRICPGDIGYNTMRMWQGRSALSSLEGIVSPAYTVVTSKAGHSSEFYSYLFKLPSVVHKFFRNSQGLVEDTLNCKFKDFSMVKVEVPDYQEQVAIANVLTTAFAEVKAYDQKLFILQQQKKGLMQKLLTGEVRVKI